MSDHQKADHQGQPMTYWGGKQAENFVLIHSQVNDPWAVIGADGKVTKLDLLGAKKAAESASGIDKHIAILVLHAANAGHLSGWNLAIEAASARVKRYFGIGAEAIHKEIQALARPQDVSAIPSPPSHGPLDGMEAREAFLVDLAAIGEREGWSFSATWEEDKQRWDDMYVNWMWWAWSQARTALAGKESDPWREAVADELNILHLPCPEDPREAIKALVAAQTRIALDPAVSREAQALVERGQAMSASILADDHQGMRVDYSGMLGQVRREISRSAPAHAEMLRQLQGHLAEVGQRFYAGEVGAVDEFLQLYCIEREGRNALKAAKEGGAA